MPARSEALEPFLTARRRRRSAASTRARSTRATATTRFSVGDEAVELELPFTQRHLAVNTLAALHAYDALGLPLDRAHEGVAGIRLSPWRGEEIALPGGGFVVNDAYNANPDSMRAALEHLAERAGDRRRIAILGEMAELGSASDEYHREVARAGSRARDRGRRSRRARPRLRARRVGRDPGRSRRPRPCADRAGRRRPRQGLARGGARRHR